MKYPGFLTKRMILFHDNVHPNTTCVTTLFLQQFYCKWLTHPPYRPGLALCNLHLFGPLKKHFEGEICE
jgi:hypothetical protein